MLGGLTEVQLSGSDSFGHLCEPATDPYEYPLRISTTSLPLTDDSEVSNVPAIGELMWECFRI